MDASRIVVVDGTIIAIRNPSIESLAAFYARANRLRRLLHPETAQRQIGEVA